MATVTTKERERGGERKERERERERERDGKRNFGYRVSQSPLFTSRCVLNFFYVKGKMAPKKF